MYSSMPPGLLRGHGAEPADHAGGRKRPCQDYRRFLSAGSSVPPLEALKLAGVDMTSPEPVRNALKIFQETIDQFRALNA